MTGRERDPLVLARRSVVKTGFPSGRILGLVTQHMYRLHNKMAADRRGGEGRRRINAGRREAAAEARRAVVENSFDARGRLETRRGG